LVPAAGGERLTVADTEIQTLTPQSPLGRALLGATEGDEAELPARQPGVPARVYEIVKVR
jgi:transcription elongation GreA/GreB family factor